MRGEGVRGGVGGGEEGSFRVAGVEVWLCEEVPGEMIAASGQTPVDLVAVDHINLRG